MIAFATPSAEAAAKSWLGGTSSDWNTAANWQGGVPVNGDDLIFTNSPTFQPSNNNIAGLTPNSIFFSNTAALSLGGNAITLGWPAAAQATTFGRVTGGTTATATNPAGHGLSVGQLFWASGAGTPFDGVFQAASVLSATTFTFTVANSGATAGSGTSGHAASDDVRQRQLFVHARLRRVLHPPIQWRHDAPPCTGQGVAGQDRPD